MKILFLTLSSEIAASSRTRVFQYVPYLRKKGIEYKIIKHRSGLDSLLGSNFKRETLFRKIIYAGLKIILKFFHLLYAFAAVMRLIFYAKKYDILFIQKALPPIWAQKILFKRNQAIVFDFDDAIYANDVTYNAKRFNYMCSIVKLAVIENESTEKYMNEKGIKTLKITGPIDCQRYKPKVNSKSLKNFTIGWVGSSSTTEYLKMIEKPLQEISKKYPNVIIKLIGTSGFNIDDCRIVKEKWSLATEVQLLEEFDIGIMPLPDNEWTRGKGGYKILQYMAMGIPSIASPVGVNKEIILQGETGFLVQSDDEWLNAFEKLIIDNNLRSRMGYQARKRAEDVYSFEANTEILISQLAVLHSQHN